MPIEIRQMQISDYDAVAALWRETPGHHPPASDRHPGRHRLLARNPGLSLVAVAQGRIVGSLVASHDGRRGFLQHLTVTIAWRGRGIAETMIEQCLERLRYHELGWVHLDVDIANETARAFWERAGWTFQNALTRLSRKL